MTDFTDLVDGYQRFRASEWQGERERWEELGKGQSPKVMVVACSDSRVEPAQIFDSKPGEIFVVRNVAALVPPFDTSGGLHGVSAALEFAVTQLKVESIVVMGHAACGGCKAALTKTFEGAAPGEGGFVAEWVGLLDDARDKITAEYGDSEEASKQMEFEGVRTSIKNLHTFPFIEQATEERDLKIHGAYFAIADGMLHVMDDSGEFKPAA